MKNNTLPIEYRPASIVNILKNSFQINELEGLIIVKGIYRKNNQSACYSGYYFDYLQDEIENHSISLRVSEKVRDKLVDKKSYIFKGTFNKYVKDDGIINTNITIDDGSYPSLGIYYTDEDSRAISLRRRKIDEGYIRIDHQLEEKLFNGIKPSIALITGNSSLALGDINSSIQNIQHAYDIKNYHINITSKDEIIRTLISLKGENFDIIILTRGGGSSTDFNVFEDADIAEIILNLDIVFVTAIGHAENKSLLQDISDRDFITPTEFGIYLEDILKTVNARLLDKNKLQEQVEEYDNRIEKYRKQSMLLFVSGVIIGLLIKLLT